MHQHHGLGRAHDLTHCAECFFCPLAICALHCCYLPAAALQQLSPINHQDEIKMECANVCCLMQSLVGLAGGPWSAGAGPTASATLNLQPSQGMFMSDLHSAISVCLAQASVRYNFCMCCHVVPSPDQHSEGGYHTIEHNVLQLPLCSLQQQQCIWV